MTGECRTHGQHGCGCEYDSPRKSAVQDEVRTWYVLQGKIDGEWLAIMSDESCESWTTTQRAGWLAHYRRERWPDEPSVYSEYRIVLRTEIPLPG
jgi:hypothetical protein